MILSEDDILTYLYENEAVMTGKHFVYTNGNHGTSYIDMRKVASHTDFIDDLGATMMNAIDDALDSELDIIIGPETLGRTLAYATSYYGGSRYIWCDMDEKEASFSPKLEFYELVAGKTVFIVDDLLTTGSSIAKVADLVRRHDGIVIGAGAIVRRTPDVTAVTCDVPTLIVLADVEGFALYEPDTCPLCVAEVPVVLRPGHGHEWIKTHKFYPYE